MPWKDPDFWERIVMAVMGASLLGFYHAAAQIRSGRPMTLRDALGVLINMVCAIVVGIILTIALADRIAGLFPVGLRDSGIIAFAFGAFGWELLPVVFPKLMARASAAVEQKVGGGQ